MLSIVLPAYNEQDVLPQTYARFSAECPKIAQQFGLDYEIIFVNDGSRDRTPVMLDEFVSRDPHVRAVHLTRNFGHQPAITAGIDCRLAGASGRKTVTFQRGCIEDYDTWLETNPA